MVTGSIKTQREDVYEKMKIHDYRGDIPCSLYVYENNTFVNAFNIHIRFDNMLNEWESGIH